MPGPTAPPHDLRARSAGRTAALAGATALTVAGLAWGLWNYGATQSWELQRLFLIALAAGAIAAASLPLRAADPRRLLPLLAVGCLLLIQILRLPILEGQGYILASVGWLGVFLGFALSRAGPGIGPGLSRTLAVVLVTLGAAEALFGLVQALGGMDAVGYGRRGLGELATGTFVNRNHFAGLLNMTLALALGLSWFGLARRRSRRAAPSETRAWSWLVVLACASIGLAVLLSRSRGGAISLLLTVGFLAGLLALDRRRATTGSAHTLPWILLMTIAGLGLAVGLDASLARFSQLHEHRARTQVYVDTLELIGDHPLAGVGPGMYRWRFRPYQSEQVELRYDHAHNDYLQTTAEWGLPVALLLWGFVFWRFHRSCRLFLTGRDLWQRALALGCAGAMLSILLHSLVDFNLQIPANLLVFGLVLGLAWAAEPGVSGASVEMGEGARREGIRRRPVARGARLAVRVGFLGLALAVLWSVFPQQRAAALGHAGSSFENLKEAARWNPRDPAVHFRLGLGYRDLPEHQDLERARRHLERAVELNPYSWSYRSRLGALYELVGRHDQARAAYSEAVRLNPRSGSYRWLQANFELRRGDLRAATEEIGRAVQLDPPLASPGLSLLHEAGADWELIDRTWPRGFDARRTLFRLVIQRVATDGRPPADRFLAALWRDLLAASEVLALADGEAYLRYLLRGRDPLQARRAWIELSARNGLSDQAYRRGDELVWNGGFERPLAGTGLGWSVRPGEGFAVERLEGEGPEGSDVLRIVFDGTTNPAFQHLEQRLVAPRPGAWRLEARVRAQEISTDQGMAFEIVDTRGRRLAATEPVTGTTPWQTVGGRFVVPRAGSEMVLRLRRQKSLRIDNKLRGSFWIDDVRSTPAAGAASPPAGEDPS